MIITKIISGGQTGADQGGLFAAKAWGIETGGWAPKGWRTEAGAAPWLEQLGLAEHASHSYADRTLANIRAADYTIIFGKPSVGSNLTRELCRENKKPCSWVYLTGSNHDLDATLIGNIIYDAKFRILNIAGNRESVSPGIRVFVESYLDNMFKHLQYIDS